MDLMFIFLIIGVFSIFIGIYNVLRYKTFEGMPKVKGYMLTFKRSGKHGKYPIITYTVDGVEHHIMGKGIFEYGKEVEVLYDSTNPANAVMVGNNGVGYIVFGVIFLIIPLLIFSRIFVIGA